MELFPAIDLRAGRCVRLTQGDFGQETVYWDDPVEVAAGFAAAGARWVHVVDLDGALTGRGENAGAIGRIAAQTGLRVQAGGGVRSADAAARLLEAGVRRVVLGTAAVEDPALVAQVADRWPGAVAVALDHRDGDVRLRGWARGGGGRVAELVPRVLEAGASAVLVTDIARDGMLAGPDVAGLAGLLEATGAPLIASGGVASLDDLRVLAGIRAGGRGLAGVVVGKALYEGRFDVAAALAACEAVGGGP
ncbi:MAG TPA: 1-(5-phosphoribosyl)-5-[(5-phosphoribosylamino)methylideneamino]imidazole-4-carboxamide isomerase [Acidimicrobiales bacterium]|nr:1-(5-phosphoribosyl)-5-[(5-phosphoribosylamino)methylideneamino]imidazole-4-carboxamide isomerase [Acidimicrobiales bacterium]